MFKSGIKKKYIIFVLLIAAAALTAYTMMNNGRVIYGISEGTYSLGSEGGATQIAFDLKETTNSKYGSFTLVSGDSAPVEGAINLSKGRLIASSESGEKYTFEVKDNDSIVFIAKKSSPLYTEDGVTPIADGSRFVYLDIK